MINDPDIPIKNYVVGYLFNHEGTDVALLRKRRPATQAGLLNGPGGLVENGESPLEAMRREFFEELGVDLPTWKKLAVLNCRENGVRRRVHFFYLRDNYSLASVEQKTDEELIIMPVRDLRPEEAVANAVWFIQMALAIERDSASEFVITEQYEVAPGAAGREAERATWTPAPNNKYYLLHQAFAPLGVVTLSGASDPAIGAFQWSANTRYECRAASLAEPEGRAHTLENAQRIVEALLICTGTLAPEQLPGNTTSQYIL